MNKIIIHYTDEKYKLIKNHNLDAAFDLSAKITDEHTIIDPGKRIKIPTGIIINLPPYWEATIRPRSELAIRYGITVFNTPGTIDSGYNGEINVLLINLGEKPYKILDGDRIAQITFQKIPRYEIIHTPYNNNTNLPNTTRSQNGFGSTGIRNQINSKYKQNDDETNYFAKNPNLNYPSTF